MNIDQITETVDVLSELSDQIDALPVSKKSVVLKLHLGIVQCLLVDFARGLLEGVEPDVALQRMVEGTNPI